jgi:hypothetical protein
MPVLRIALSRKGRRPSVSCIVVRHLVPSPFWAARVSHLTESGDLVRLDDALRTCVFETLPQGLHGGRSCRAFSVDDTNGRTAVDDSLLPVRLVGGHWCCINIVDELMVTRA